MLSYQAEFEQTDILEDGNKIKSKGAFFIAYPSKFRFTYNYGDWKGFDVIGDGKNIIIYQPELRSANKISYENYSLGEPLMYLLKTTDINKIPFDLFYAKINSNEEVITFKSPEKNSDKSETEVFFKNKILNRVKEKNNGKEVLTIQFRAVDVKSKLPANTFKFVPPEGVDFF